MICACLPYPPSLNNLYVNVTGKGRRKSKRYASWCVVADTAIQEQRVKWGDRKIEGPVEICITLEKRGRKMDLDNSAKALIDTLVRMGIIDDDRNLEKLTIKRGPVEGALVQVWEWREE